MPALFAEITAVLGDRQRLRSFVFDSKCVPWRVKAYFKRRFLVAYRLLRYGRVNINTAAHWDQIWEREGRGTWRQYPERFGRIAGLVPSGARVLDVGCGVGVLLARLRYERQCNVFGVDISTSAIRMIGELGIEGAVAVMPRLPFATGSFDVITATELIEHLDAPLAALRELGRCLRPGGLLILTTPDNALAPWQEDYHMQVFTPATLSALATSVLSEFHIASVEDQWQRNGELVTEHILLLHGRSHCI